MDMIDINDWFLDKYDVFLEFGNMRIHEHVCLIHQWIYEIEQMYFIVLSMYWLLNQWILFVQHSIVFYLLFLHHYEWKYDGFWFWYEWYFCLFCVFEKIKKGKKMKYDEK